MPAMRYLTVQDVLWINLWATRTVNPYRYADLEEAAYYQYAYGDSDEPTSQAARLAKGFLAKAPLDKGNESTAFVAVLSFLLMNGLRLNVEDSEAGKWFENAARGTITDLVDDSEQGHETVRSAVREIVRQFPRTLLGLGATPVEIVADGAIH